jgi:hypothetical protein
MKSFVKAVAVAAVIVAPALSFAQSDSSVSRSQVKQDLQRVEAAGYDPAVNDQTTYPADVQAAERRAQGQNGAMPGANNANTSYGGTANGSSVSGMRMRQPLNNQQMNNDGTKPVYFGH